MLVVQFVGYQVLCDSPSHGSCYRRHENGNAKGSREETGSYHSQCFH
jgi:hypothetical protein